MKRATGIVVALALMCSVAGQAAEAASKKLEEAMFAAGCFWKVQYVFSKVPGVVRTTVGYSGGKTLNPSYKEVCGDKTGHAETVLVEYDPEKVTYKQLLRTFWTNHDPTTMNRQGPDVGTQYRSVVFYTNEAQHQDALAVRAELDKARKFGAPIVTSIEPAGKFYKGEDYHQNYFEKHGMVCH